MTLVRAPSRSLEATRTLTAGLAHEIRNPLHGALLHTRVLERELAGAPVSAGARASVRTIEHELRRIAAFLDEFVEFARPQPLVLERVSLERICRRAAEVTGPLAERAGVSVDVALASGDLEVDADRERLCMAIANLVTNAIESIAASGRPGRVIVRVRSAGVSACVEVEDDGPGLRDEGARIFDVFFSTKPDGTGLGLPVAHRIVCDHGGEVVVEAQPGATVFRVLLPPRSEAAT